MKHWLAFAVGCLLLANDARAQTVTLPAQPACRACTVQLSPVARLGSADDPAGFAVNAEAVMTKRGEFLVSSSTFIGEIYIYDRNGKFVRSIGRRGAGPGEFSAPLHLGVDAQDTVRAVEMGGGARYHVIAPDNTVKRTTPLGVRVFDVAVEADGQLFAATPGATTTLSYFDRLGQRQTLGKLPTSSNPNEQLRYVATGANGTRWSLGLAAYVLERWLPDGTSAQKLTAERDWLPKGPLPTRLDIRTERPPARFTGLLIDAQGRLFVFAAVADANWKPTPAVATPPDPSKFFDTLIEVIDPRTGGFIASTRLDGIVVPMHGTLAYSMVEDDVGDRRLQVWNVSLIQR